MEIPLNYMKTVVSIVAIFKFLELLALTWMDPVKKVEKSLSTIFCQVMPKTNIGGIFGAWGSTIVMLEEIDETLETVSVDFVDA